MSNVLELTGVSVNVWLGQIWNLGHLRPSNFMGLPEGHSEADRQSLPHFHHLLIKVSSDFLTIYNGGVMPCKSMAHQLKIISWDINDMWL